MRATHFLLGALAAVAVAATTAARAEELGYDPVADPFAQIIQAEAAAAKDHKLILVVAGGDWCVWCHYLNAFLQTNADVDRALEDTFVVVHVNFSPENKNERFFATLPEAVGYPHFWVLAADGTLLHSQNTAPLENGKKGYEKSRFVEFIGEWQAKRQQ